MKSLVTGGAGFLGSHLVETLIARGDEVVVLDDLSTGSRSNLAAAVRTGRCTLQVGSVTEATSVARAAAGVDRIFHLAAVVGVRRVLQEPVRTLHTSIEGTGRVLDEAVRRGTPLLVTSSSEVYGRGVRFPFREEDDVRIGSPESVRWRYACAKALEEHLVLARAEAHDLPVVVPRLFNIVGPRQTGRFGMVLPTFVDDALAGRSLRIHGDGSQQRSFLDVAIAAPLLIRLLEAPGARGRTINVGSDQEIPILDLARLVLARTGSRSGIRFVPVEEAYGVAFRDVPRRVPDLTRLRESVGEVAPTDLAAVIDRMVAEREASGTDATGDPRMAGVRR